MNAKGRVLVVDDDTDIQNAVRDVLELDGYEIELAGDGFAALDAATRCEFDAILMDVRMPGMDGVETYMRLKQIAPRTPVIMVTAYSVDAQIAEALREGAFAALNKPLDFDQLFETLENARGGPGGMALIVDDDEDFRHGMKLALEEKSYVVRCAEDGYAALKMVRENYFDFVILDMRMPGMNGLDTFMAIKSFRPHAKVILVTGYPDEIKKLGGDSAGVNAFACLEKPLSMDFLFELMAKAPRCFGAGNDKLFDN